MYLYQYVLDVAVAGEVLVILGPAKNSSPKYPNCEVSELRRNGLDTDQWFGGVLFADVRFLPPVDCLHLQRMVMLDDRQCDENRNAILITWTTARLVFSIWTSRR